MTLTTVQIQKNNLLVKELLSKFKKVLDVYLITVPLPFNSKRFILVRLSMEIHDMDLVDSSHHHNVL